ncbi:AraC family transcriptional regulator [Algivirga pacifica]|uniref:4-hydroxyphenylacetate catabolism regulatory protein HpaA n=1 Tax=Algivirga pacifica TaxID=1162670 RepID=A0ABP9DKS8_9BACT
MAQKLKVNDKLSNSGQLLKVAPFRSYIRKTAPHRHNGYFEIIYLNQGSGSHTIDGVTYAIQPPILFMMQKEQMHHWDIHTEPKGYVLIVKKAFFQDSLDSVLQELLFKLSGYTILENIEHQQLHPLFTLLEEELNTSSPYQQSNLEGLLKALFGRCLSYASQQAEKKDISNSLFLAYKKLIEQEDYRLQNIKDYAALLHTSPQNLNHACRKAVQLSASDYLAEELIREAKRLLLYTDMSVAEIGFHLHFSDPSHFSKYFKRYTQVTPKNFRSEKG